MEDKVSLQPLIEGRALQAAMADTIVNRPCGVWGDGLFARCGFGSLPLGFTHKNRECRRWASDRCADSANFQTPHTQNTFAALSPLPCHSTALGQAAQDRAGWRHLQEIRQGGSVWETHMAHTGTWRPVKHEQSTLEVLAGSQGREVTEDDSGAQKSARLPSEPPQTPVCSVANCPNLACVLCFAVQAKWSRGASQQRHVFYDGTDTEGVVYWCQIGKGALRLCCDRHDTYGTDTVTPHFTHSRHNTQHRQRRCVEGAWRTLHANQPRRPGGGVRRQANRDIQAQQR